MGVFIFFHKPECIATVSWNALQNDIREVYSNNKKFAGFILHSPENSSHALFTSILFTYHIEKNAHVYFSPHATCGDVQQK